MPLLPLGVVADGDDVVIGVVTVSKGMSVAFGSV